MSRFNFRVWDKARKTIVNDGDLWLPNGNAISHQTCYPAKITSAGIAYTKKLSADCSGYVEVAGKTYYEDFETTVIAMQGVVLMQSTGLKDKNGVEIFEGDIIQTSISGKKYQISWYESEMSCRWVKISAATGSMTDIGKENNLYVVGNIWENPELLDKK